MFTTSLLLMITMQFATIQGQVRDARTHQPIRAAKVELWHSQIPVAWQYTDNDGAFRFANYAAGTYVATVSHPEYDNASSEIDSNLSYIVRLELARKKERPTPRNPVVGIRELLLVPKSAQKEFAAARKEAKRDDCANAVPHFESGIRAFDQDASAHNDLGNCYRKLGQLDLAEKSFKTALELRDSVYVAMNLSEVYMARSKFDEAAAVMNASIRKNPNAGDPYYGLGLVYLYQELLEQAEGAFVQAASRPHKLPDVHVVLADIYWQHSRVSDATKQLEEYLKEEPRSPRSDQVREMLKQLPR